MTNSPVVYRIILQGPLSSRGTATRALQSGGVTVASDETAQKDGAHIHAHVADRALRDGEDQAGYDTWREDVTGGGQGYITCHHADVDRVVGLVGSLGWALRSHRAEVVRIQTTPTQPSAGDPSALLVARLDDMEREIAALKAGGR